MSKSRVIYRDLGLRTLERDAENVLASMVLDPTAREIETRMKNLIRQRFFATGATHDSVDIIFPDRLTREIGPHTSYAIFGEMGWVQRYLFGRRLQRPIYHPAKHFARDALVGAIGLLVARMKRAMRTLGK